MERLIETIAEYLCRHRSVGLLRLTLDLTRHRLDLFAEIGAAEVAKGAIAPPTPGTDTWWRATAAVREAVVTQEGASPVRAGGGGDQLDGPAQLTDPPPTKPPTAKNGALLRLFSRLSFRETPKNGASTSLNAV